jgi:hypothetical protein
MDNNKIAKYMKNITLIVLLILNSLMFLFSLFSGAEQFGEGIKSILLNSPNALPWLVLFAFIYVAWKWELIGGMIFAFFGLLTIIFFDTYTDIIVKKDIGSLRLIM